MSEPYTMQRRDFLLTTTLAVTPLATLAQARFESGKDYRTLAQAVRTEAPPGQVEVVEFFSYNCPHCNSFEPVLQAWVDYASKHIAFRRIPVPFVGGNPKLMQQLYYTLEAMDLIPALHAKVFRAIHAERKRFDRAETVADWAAAQNVPGFDKAKFLEQFKSFSVASKVNRANQLVAAYQIDGVPSLGVAGRYYTDATLTRDMRRCLDVVDYLAAEVKKGR